jgi:uncharacterized protein YwqG
VTPQQLRNRLAAFGSAADALADRALPAVRLVPGGRGRSRLGGLPDLPPEAGWPQGHGRPMLFVAQIDLAELGAVAPAALPGGGLLSFFADLSKWLETGGRVLHHDLPADSFSRRSPPPGPENRSLFGLLKSHEPVRVYREAALSFEATTSLPDPGRVPGLPADREDELAAFVSGLNDGHRLLGHPYLIQNPMEEECAARLPGVPASDWRLLLQIGSDEKNSDMMWADNGMLYWWIPAADLPAGRFDRVQLLAQFC